MAEVAEPTNSSPTELLAAGRRHLAVREFSTAVETLAKACEALAKEHGDTADQCGEAYLWYGKALLGLSREESGVLGDGVPGTGNADEEDDDNDEQEENDDNEAAEENGGADMSTDDVKDNREATSSGVEKSEAESTTKDEQAPSSSNAEAGASNGDAADESMMDPEAEDDVDNLQLAWEMLDLSRSIILRRVQDGGGDTARALLADIHLALGEVALESETYDKAVLDMQSCLELQKDLYGSDDRRIAETNYQIGLANSLASNFEDAITHFKNAANILESRIKTLENPTSKDDATVKKYSTSDPFYSIEGEIKELKELLPEIQEKIQDMMDYKAEITIEGVRTENESPVFLNPDNQLITLCTKHLYSGELYLLAVVSRMVLGLPRTQLIRDAALLTNNGFEAVSLTIKRVRESLLGPKSDAPTNGASSSAAPKPAASDISHLIKRKRKASDEQQTEAKRVNKASEQETKKVNNASEQDAKKVNKASEQEAKKVNSASEQEAKKVT